MGTRLESRLANWTLRDPVITILQMFWVVAALTALDSELSAITTAHWGWSGVGLFVVLALAYSMKMRMVQPRLVLTSILGGAVAFAAVAGLRGYFGFPSSPLLLGALVGSGIYLYLGDRWTKKFADQPTA